MNGLAFIAGGVGGLEWLVLFVVVLIVYGPRRLPSIARRLGHLIERFNRENEVFYAQLLQEKNDTGGIVSPVDAEPGSGAELSGGEGVMEVTPKEVAARESRGERHAER